MQVPEEGGKLPRAELLLATVSTVAGAGISLLIDGTNAPTQKYYRRLANGQTLRVGDRVLVAKLSGTYIVLGKVGTGAT